MTGSPKASLANALSSVKSPWLNKKELKKDQQEAWDNSFTAA